MIEAVRGVMPTVRRIGTLYSPGEVNSSLARERFLAMLKAGGLELVSVPVSSPTEVSDAAASLCQSGVDAVCQISDNLSNSSFPAISRACESARMPLFTFSPAYVNRGAVVGVGCNFEENGREAGLLVAEVIRGRDPARIPFAVTTKVTRSANLDVARRLGLTVPRDWLKTASQMIDRTAAKKAKGE
jgi:putative ABC transport system substrate-binding protein